MGENAGNGNTIVWENILRTRQLNPLDKTSENESP